MFGYVKAIRLHYRKKSDLNYTNTSEPIKFDPDIIQQMADDAKGPEDETSWGMLHDYLLDVAHHHYSNPEHAEEYARNHTDFLRHHWLPGKVNYGRLDFLRENLGHRTKPVHALVEGDVIRDPYRPQRYEPVTVHTIEPVPDSDTYMHLGFNPHDEGDFQQLRLHHPVIYHPPETPKQEQTQPQEPQQ